MSSGRYLCKYCKVWLGDDKVSRQLHDGGPTHKKALETFLIAQHEKNKARCTQQAVVAAEIQRVNEAAHASYRLLDLASSYEHRKLSHLKELRTEHEKLALRDIQSNDSGSKGKRKTTEAKSSDEAAQPERTKDAATGYGVWEDVDTEVGNEKVPARAHDKRKLSTLHDDTSKHVKQVKPGSRGVVKDVIFKKRTRGGKSRRKKSR